jgi:hypothetical protein
MAGRIYKSIYKTHGWLHYLMVVSGWRKFMPHPINPCDNGIRTLHTHTRPWGCGVCVSAGHAVNLLVFQLAAILSRLPIGALDSLFQATCNDQTCSKLHLRARSNASKVRPNEVVLGILRQGGLAIASKPGTLAANIQWSLWPSKPAYHISCIFVLRTGMHR